MAGVLAQSDNVTLHLITVDIVPSAQTDHARSHKLVHLRLDDRVLACDTGYQLLCLLDKHAGLCCPQASQGLMSHGRPGAYMGMTSVRLLLAGWKSI